MRKIKKLTPEQEADLPVFRQHYFDLHYGHRADRAKLQVAINDAYAVIGKPAPMLFILKSPLQAMAALQVLKNKEANLRDSLRDSLWVNLHTNLRANLGDNLSDNLIDNLEDSLRDSLWVNLRDNLWDSLRANLHTNLMANLGDSLRANLGDNLWDSLRANLHTNLMANLEDNLRANLGDNLWANLGDNLWRNLHTNLRDNLEDSLRDNLWANLEDIEYNSNYLWGSQDLYWICWARFAEKIGVKFNPNIQKKLTIMESIASQCEWWWPYEGLCVVSERPVYTKWDEQKRLHCETGPSVEYEDGFAVHSWHGTSIPAEWINDKSSITPQVALTWENMEQRRAACEIVGWNNVIKQLNPRIVDQNANPQIGTLVEVELPDIGREKFLRVQCGTGREFALAVPPEMQTAHQANAWTWGLKPEEYNPEIRT